MSPMQGALLDIGREVSTYSAGALLAAAAGVVSRKSFALLPFTNELVRPLRSSLVDSSTTFGFILFQGILDQNLQPELDYTIATT